MTVSNTHDANRDLLRREPPAWPTTILFMVVLAATIATWHGAIRGEIADITAIGLLAVCSYAMFTVMHEAVHRSVFKGNAANTFIGTVASIWMGPTSSFTAYRALHLEHHQHTNDRHRDPDHYNGRGPRWWRPISWLTTDLFYYYFYLSTSSRRPWRERVRVVVENISFLGFFVVLCAYGFAYEAILYWLLPTRLTTFFLSFGFNFLPHRPHCVLAEHDPDGATQLVGNGSLFAAIALMGHDLHVIHHRFPGVPFYRYREVLRRIRHGELTRPVHPTSPSKKGMVKRR